MSSSGEVQQQKCVLSKTRTAYARAGEEMTTLIIRDSSAKCCKVFGVKGRDNLYKLYYGTLALLKANRCKIMQKDERKFAFLSHFLDSLGVEDVQEMDRLDVRAADEQLRVSYLRLMPIIKDDHPRVGLYLYYLADVYVTAIHLFVDQLVKLLKWMNQNQNIGVTKFFTYNTNNDDFLDFMSD